MGPKMQLTSYFCNPNGHTHCGKSIKKENKSQGQGRIQEKEGGGKTKDLIWGKMSFFGVGGGGEGAAHEN